MLPTAVENGIRADAAGRSGSRGLNTLLLAAFFVALLLVIPDPSKFHGDERFYTDAAIQMMQTGDYWTPFFADGRIRLLKPILTYWTVVGSFQVFGVDYFAARLPSLVAGVLVLLLTWQLARTVFNSNRTALLAVLIMASNSELLTLSTRATPDALVCLFVLASMWGFARVWFAGDRSFAGALLVFGGMGLAVQTKGLLGLCPLAANLLFWLLARPAGVRLKSFLNWPAIAVGIGLGMFWYAVMLQRHGAGALRDFYADQVGAKVTANPAFVLGSFALYLVAVLRHFLPWTLLLVAALIWGRRELAGFWNRYRNECLFLLLLSAILIVVFALGKMSRARYLAASYPMLAVFVAGALSGFLSDQRLQRWLGRIIRFAAFLVLLVGMGVLAGGFSLGWRLAVGGAALAGLGFAGMLAARSVAETGRWIWISATVVMAFAVLGVCIRPVLSPSPLVQAVATMNRLSPDERIVFVWRVSDTVAGQLRLLSGGKLTVKTLAPEAGGADLAAVHTVITVSPHQQILADAGYQLGEVGPADPAQASSWLGRLMLEKTANAHNNPRQTFWVAVKSR
jgi:4-amino-4-deoxy-L-arabinose transferase-like glycosyltransferase